eukprot:905425-Amphidinium_carterae.1
MAASEKERPMQTSIKRQEETPRVAIKKWHPNSGQVSLDGATVSPESKATALLTTHRQRSDTCRKPGTAFIMEYQTPGADVRTLLVQALCRNAAFIAISGNNRANQSVLDFLEPTLRSEHTLQSTTCIPSSFYAALIRSLLFSLDVPFALNAPHVCRESVLLTSRTISAREPPIGVQ